MAWSGQAHVMNNMYGSGYTNNMSSAAATHGAFFRYMRQPAVKQESADGILTITPIFFIINNL